MGWKLAALLALLVMALAATKLARDPGITTDEIVQRAYGDLILDWYRTGFVKRDALSYINLYLYGGMFDLLAQSLLATGLLPWGTYESRHVLTALVSLLGVVATWLAVNRIRGPRAAFLASAMLVLTPAWTGHSLFNPKDIPFGAATAFVLYASVRIALFDPAAPLRWGDALCAAVCLGFALAVRSGGMFLLAYPLMALGLRVLCGVLRGELRLRAATRITALSTARLICVFPLTWLLMLSTWPWAQQAPFTRPFQAAAIAANFEWPGKMRFDGEIVSFRHLPLHYLPKWFLVTLPELYALALLCGALVLWYRWFAKQKPDSARTAALVLLALTVLVPYLGVVIARPTLYDGHRHFLFVIPSMAALAGLAFDYFISCMRAPVALRATLGALALGLAGVTLYDMVTLHPYEYVYFNRASGGLAKQATRFEADYWGASYREGLQWVFKNYDPGGTRKILIKTCASDKLIGYYRKQSGARRFVLAKSQSAAEVYLGVTKRNCHERPGEVIHTVERQGVPLLYIRSRPRP